MTTHVPSLAAADGAEPRRSLILAGGGMRVAYQAGVLLALEEAGLSFSHADGTSGGTINLGMLLSGLSPAEMCERWRTLKVSDFGSPLPLGKYLELDLPALGDADGVVNKVFPHLGVDPERIRSARGLEGTFNVCNYTRKTLEVVPHTEIDLDLLVAGISLPIFMPVVRRGEFLYTDAVWIKDANLLEAFRRGSEEIWLVWCIGNVARYRNGLFNQYVHMIELAANGSLFEDLERIRDLGGTQTRPRVHVIKPSYPLPLDPDFYLGRITGDELVALGYADAKQYLGDLPEQGLAWGPELTMMDDSGPGVSFRETLTGSIGGEQVTLDARVDVPVLSRFLAGPAGEGRLTGHIEYGSSGKRPVAGGRFAYASSADGRGVVLEYEARVADAAGAWVLVARKELRDDPGFDFKRDLTRASTEIRRADGSVLNGELESGLAALARGIEGQNADTLRERSQAAHEFGRFLLRQLWGVYGRKL